MAHSTAASFVRLETPDGNPWTGRPEEGDGAGVVIVRLDRPKANALSAAMLAQMADAVAALVAEPPGAVVVYGGPRIFAAGADIGEFLSGPDGERGGAAVGEGFRGALDALASFPRATVAAIEGYALGGGLEVALACDFRFAAASARLGLPEVTLGIIPGGGGTQRLPRLVGPARAKQMILSGEHVGAERAMEIGLVDRVVPDGQALTAAASYCAELASGALLAQAAAKQLIDRAAAAGLASGLDAEAEAFSRIFATQDARAGISSFLASGPGKARFAGR